MIKEFQLESKYLFSSIWKTWWGREKWGWERKRVREFYPLVHFQMPVGLGGIRPELWNWNSNLVSHMGDSCSRIWAIILCLPRCISTEKNWVRSGDAKIETYILLWDARNPAAYSQDRWIPCYFCLHLEVEAPYLLLTESMMEGSASLQLLEAERVRLWHCPGSNREGCLPSSAPHIQFLLAP